MTLILSEAHNVRTNADTANSDKRYFVKAYNNNSTVCGHTLYTKRVIST